jgi:AraC-like DNA-binding protein
LITFSQLVDGLQIRLTPFAVCEIRSGAGLRLEDAKQTHLHYVLEGSAAVRRPNKSELPLGRHGVMILPAGVRVTVECGEQAGVHLPEPRCRPIPGGWDWIDVGDGSTGAVLACAYVEATHQGAIGLFDYLREPIAENMADESAFGDAMQLLLTELAWPKPGTPALAAILMKQCLILLLRRYWEGEQPRAPWLAALRQPQLGKAIAAMFDDPRSPFTLQQLAEIAGMSRAVFAENFKKTFGRSAMQYLKEVRLRRATELLESTDLPIKTIAARVGFQSRSYFTRAFRTFAGVDPTRYREAWKAEPPATQSSD